MWGSGSTAGSNGDVVLLIIYQPILTLSSTVPVSGHFFVIDPDDASDVTYVVGQNTIWSSSSNLIINN